MKEDGNKTKNEIKLKKKAAKTITIKRICLRLRITYYIKMQGKL